MSNDGGQQFPETAEENTMNSGATVSFRIQLLSTCLGTIGLSSPLPGVVSLSTQQGESAGNLGDSAAFSVATAIAPPLWAGHAFLFRRTVPSDFRPSTEVQTWEG